MRNFHVKKQSSPLVVIFVAIGVACSVAAVIFAITKLFNKECCECDFEFDDDFGDEDFDFGGEDEEEACGEDCGCDENGCAYTSDADFEKS